MERQTPAVDDRLAGRVDNHGISTESHRVVEDGFQRDTALDCQRDRVRAVRRFEKPPDEVFVTPNGKLLPAVAGRESRETGSLGKGDDI